MEFLIAFLPVHVFFLCLLQSAILYSVRLVLDHAALNTARAAAVVIGDDPENSVYGGQGGDPSKIHTLVPGSRKYESIRRAALLTLSPLILMGTVQTLELAFPPSDEPGGEPQEGEIQFSPMTGSNISKIRVRLEVEAVCRISFASFIMCPSPNDYLRVVLPSQLAPPIRRVRSEAVFPYQGASYKYGD